MAEHTLTDTVQARRETLATRVRFTPWSVWILFFVTAALNAATWWYVFWKFPYTDATIFLHYSIFFGIDLTGEWWRILIIPGTGTGILLLHSLIFFSRTSRHSLMPLLSFSLAGVFQVILLTALIMIIRINQ